MKSELFLGLPCESGTLQINHVNFDEHLLAIEHEGQIFVGKKLGNKLDKEVLFNTEAHIYSLLRKVDPSFSFKKSSLVLFPIPQLIS